MIHNIKYFSIVREAKVDVFLELSFLCVFLEFSCFLYDPMDVGILISGSSAFPKSSLYIWKFLVHIVVGITNLKRRRQLERMD